MRRPWTNGAIVSTCATCAIKITFTAASQRRSRPLIFALGKFFPFTMADHRSDLARLDHVFFFVRALGHPLLFHQARAG